MKIGIISDIHDNIANLLKSFDLLKKERVERVFFCGDLTSPFTIDYFRKLKLPVSAIFGNNEGDKIGILRRVEGNNLKDFKYAPKQGFMWNLKLKNKRIGVYHGFQEEILETLINSGSFDIFLSGHNHVAHIKNVGKTLWVNPGSVCGWAGLDIKPVKPSIATLEIATLKAEIIPL
jgi:putative phosphoesterase